GWRGRSWRPDLPRLPWPCSVSAGSSIPLERWSTRAVGLTHRRPCLATTSSPTPSPWLPSAASTSRSPSSSSVPADVPGGDSRGNRLNPAATVPARSPFGGREIRFLVPPVFQAFEALASRTLVNKEGTY